MKSQAIIFLTLFCLIALFSNASANVSPQQLRQLIATQGPCILGKGPCDAIGEEMKKQLPILLRGCTLKGCERADKRIRQLAEIVRKSDEPLWRAVITKYVLHK